MSKRILAAFDEGGLFVYQAFSPEIVEAALERGTFGRGFNLDRMTWIKPSFGWMLYRSGYAGKHRQERIVRVRLRHEGFRAILSRSVPTVFNPDRFATEHDWRGALRRSEVRHQWDPDRDLHLRPLSLRALQLGLSGQTVREYVGDWILGLEDVTPLAHAVRDAVASKGKLPDVPEERVYPLDGELWRRLGCTEEEASAPQHPAGDAGSRRNTESGNSHGTPKSSSQSS
jgi:hypothetical protein